MKLKRFFLCMLALTLLLSGCGRSSNDDDDDDYDSSESGDSVFGSFTAKDLKGNTVDEDVFENCELTMVNIWATFCGPCINEMPDLGELDDAGGENFQVIGIVLDVTDPNGKVISSQKSKAEKIIDQTGADYLHILPNEDLNDAFLGQVQVVPTTVFVDKNGNQVGEVYTGSMSKEQWESVIEDLMEEVR